MTEIFKRILSLKRKSGLMWEDIAKAADIPLSSWMTGLEICSPTDDELHKLAPVLKTSYTYLKTGKE